MKLNRMTTRQRKLLYAGIILALSVPIIVLGRPSSEPGTGGLLTQKRELPVAQGGYDLGETTFGRIDPTSSVMNLALLGLRGVAANILWMKHDDYKRQKNWAEMRAVTESIITLQPHFLQVWRFHGWNLAYNVSAEWDAVADRWYWVKEGGKFTMKGAARNRIYSELPWVTGRILGQKVGRSDEWRQFRGFFRDDPDDYTWGENRPDTDFNRPPVGVVVAEPFADNYLAAKAWYLDANRLEVEHDQHIMWRPLFRHYPMRSQLDYAEALQRDGTFGEITRGEWVRAYNEWTGEDRTRLAWLDFEYQAFGKDEYESSFAGLLMLDPTEAELRALADKDKDRRELRAYIEERYKQLPPPADGKAADYEAKLLAVKRDTVQQDQNTTNYLYWKRRARLEKRDEMVELHYQIHLGKEAYRKGRVDFGPNGEKPESIQHLEKGLLKYVELRDELAQSENASELREEMRDLNIKEEILMAMIYWRYIIEQINGRQVPEDFPLNDFWQDEDNQQTINDLRGRFLRETSG